MSNNLCFDLLPTKTGRQLAITGPATLMRDASGLRSDEFQRGIIGKNRMYGYLSSEDDSMLTWILNAKRLGQVHDQGHRDKFLVETNGFIHEVLRLARRSKVESDPRLNMLDYVADGAGDFLFVADVIRPAAKHDDVKHLVIGAMQNTAQAMRYPRRGEQAEEGAQSTIAYRARFDHTAVVMALSPNSQVRSTRGGFNWSEHSFLMTGHNVQDGPEPLIFLAGAVAMAHADEILDPTTLVQQL